jgi:hypothetical protein
MKLNLSVGLAAGLIAISAAPALAAPTVTVRVEGANATLLERTAVTLGSAMVNGCAGNTASAAIEAATHGDWDRQQYTKTILGETHDFSSSDYWAEWLNHGSGYKAGGGICTDALADGDEVLMLADHSGPAPDYPPSVLPLDLEGVPATAVAGGTVTVTVVEYRSATLTPGEGTRTPVAGATVTGGAAPVATGPDGTAVVRFGSSGTALLRARRPGDAPSAGFQVRVTVDGSAGPGLFPGPAVPDHTPPAGTIAGLKDHASLKTGPRELRGSFADSSSIADAKLRLTKRVGSRCWYFSGRSETFRRTGCGKGSYFSIGAKADWSYLLPSRLGAGRYVLDAIAIDGAGNRTPLARGTTRVVFTVR